MLLRSLNLSDKPTETLTRGRKPEETFDWPHPANPVKNKAVMNRILFMAQMGSEFKVIGISR